MKHEFELLLNRGKLFYTKSGLFGINISSSYQFGGEVFKLAPAAQPGWSNQIHLLRHRAPGSKRWSKEPIFFGRWIISFGVMIRPLGSQQGGYGKPFLYIRAYIVFFPDRD
jgi:hypothetical protein